MIRYDLSAKNNKVMEEAPKEEVKKAPIKKNGRSP